jgi:hypothetical protein
VGYEVFREAAGATSNLELRMLSTRVDGSNLTFHARLAIANAMLRE